MNVRILFWGTPEFACPALRAIVGEGQDVVSVITQPDRPQGRSRTELVPPPIKVVALEEGIPVLQPDKPWGDEFLSSLRDLSPDLSVVVAYGHILRREVIQLPAFGTWNIHASLLPRWRGASPIQAAILAGDTESGVSVMQMVSKLDAGPVLLQAPTPIAADETGGELTERLAELAALAIVEALTLRSLGAVRTVEQDEARVTCAGKVGRESARLDFTRSAIDVGRAIRAYDPKPGAWSTLRGLDTKLSGALVIGEARGDPGQIIDIDEAGMLVACAQGAVRIGYAQPAGRRRMTALDLAQGRTLAVGDVLGG